MVVRHDQAGLEKRLSRFGGMGQVGGRGRWSNSEAHRARRRRQRRVVLAGMEPLERRDLRAADLSFFPQYDVDGDGTVAPLDALLIANQMTESNSVVTGHTATTFDVNQDGAVSGLDVAAVLAQVTEQLQTQVETQVGGDTNLWSDLGVTLGAGVGASAAFHEELEVDQEIVGDTGGGAATGTGADLGSEGDSNFAQDGGWGGGWGGGWDDVDLWDWGDNAIDGMGLGDPAGWPCEEAPDAIDEDFCGPPTPLPEVTITSRVADGRASLHEVKEKLIPTDPDGYFVVTVDHPLDHDLLVQLTVDGQLSGNGAATGFATNGIDHSLLPNSVVIPAGETSAELIVIVNNDLTVESTEKIRVLVQPGAGYRAPATSAAAELTIDDNDRWQWESPEFHAPAWSRLSMTPAWDLDSWLGGMGIVDPHGWVMVKGGVALSPQGNGVSAVLDADFHGWRNLVPFWRSEINLNAGQLLDVNFDFDQRSGNIYIRSGSGISDGSPGAEFAKNQELTAALGFNYAIDNGFAATEHVVTVNLTAIVGVDGTMTTSVSGGIQPGGRTGSGNRDGGPTSEISGSGGINVSFTESSNKSYVALQETVHYTLRLKVVEQDP